MIKQSLISLLLFLLLFVTSSAFAGETGKISGKITDEKTGEVLVGANVIIVSKLIDGREEKLQKIMGASTDIEGDFFILNIPPGVYNLKASYIGYTGAMITNISVDIDKTTKVNFSLRSEAIQTEDVVVTAYSPLKVEPDVTATKQVYNIADVQGMAGVSSLTDILELQADVIDDHFRGGRIGQSTYLIGGASISNPLSNQRSFSPIVTGLQQVEVYTSGFSAEYGNAQSGVVNMVAKEGGENWETRLEASTTPPYYKTFGGSAYNPSNLPFYNILNNDPSAWFELDPSIGKALFTTHSSILGAFNPLNLRDSLEVARLVQTAWLQSIRKVGLEYANRYDYRLDFTTGGPIADGVKLFLAARQNITNPVVPTANPDIERQVMSNITYQASQSDKVKINFIFASDSRNVLGSNWEDWLFEPTVSVTKNVQTTKHYGIEWNRVLSDATFMDLKFNLLNVQTEDNIEIVNDDEYRELYQKNLTFWPDYTGPSQHSSAKLQGTRGTQKLSTYDIQGSINSQLNKYNLLKTGFQLSYYDLNVDRQSSITSIATVQKIKFHNFPLEGALYLQDKMEFEGFIANLGLRFDFYNMNTDYYSDIYSPLRNPNRLSDNGLDYYNRELAAKGNTELYTKLQPRIGISFPLTETSVFHLNYGTFTQRPSFTQIFYNQISYYNDIQFLGNPLLKPENTRAYDIGLVNAFPFGIRLDVSAYYKDVTNLIEISNFEDAKTQKYKTYTNREYADIKGFIINIEKSDGALKGSIKYNFEAAKGKNSNDLASPITYSEIKVNNKLPDPEDVYLDYDRTHKAIFNVRYKTASKDGFNFGKIYPLGNMSFSVTFRVSSGRPYTYDASGQGLKFNVRTPTETELRMRIEKTIKFGNTNVLIYGEGFNLLNTIIYNYTRVFNDPNSSLNLTTWQNEGEWKDDTVTREGIRWYDEFQPYISDQSMSVISNQPRYFRFGVIFNF